MKDFIAKWIVIVVLFTAIGALVGVIDWHFAERTYSAVDDLGTKHKFRKTKPEVGSTWEAVNPFETHAEFTIVSVTEHGCRTGIIEDSCSVGSHVGFWAFIFCINCIWAFPALALLWWAFRRVFSPREKSGDET